MYKIKNYKQQMEQYRNELDKSYGVLPKVIGKSKQTGKYQIGVFDKGKIVLSEELPGVFQEITAYRKNVMLECIDRRKRENQHIYDLPGEEIEILADYLLASPVNFMVPALESVFGKKLSAATPIMKFKKSIEA